MGRAALLLASLLVVAYWGVVFHRGSLVYSDNYNPLDPRPSAASYGPGFVHDYSFLRRGLLLHPNFHDPGGAWWQWEPGAVFLRRGLLGGEPPWWDPYVGAGAPAMANVIPTFFFPPYLAVVLLGDTPLLRTLYSLALLLAAGLFSFAFLRKHGLGFAASLLGGAAYVFSGAMTQNVGSFIGQTAACLPAALWLCKRFLDRPSWRRTAALAAGFAVISLSSFPPVLVEIFGRRRPLCPGADPGRGGRRRGGGAWEMARSWGASPPAADWRRGWSAVTTCRSPRWRGRLLTSRRRTPAAPGPSCRPSASSSCCRRR